MGLVPLYKSPEVCFLGFTCHYVGLKPYRWSSLRLAGSLILDFQPPKSKFLLFMYFVVTNLTITAFVEIFVQAFGPCLFSYC